MQEWLKMYLDKICANIHWNNLKSYLYFTAGAEFRIES